MEIQEFEETILVYNAVENVGLWSIGKEKKQH